MPRPGLADQGGNVGGSGTANTREARRAVDGVEEVPDMSQANSWTSASAATRQDATPAIQMINLSSVVEQADDRKVRPLEQAQVDSAYAVYKGRIGDYPRPEEDVTPEQVATLRAPFSSGSLPHVELSMWGPYGRRL